jgi:hypothetical protein
LHSGEQLTTTATKPVLTRDNVDDLIPRPAGEIKRERKFNMLIYGLPGAGKTHLAGSADEVPECRTVLHLDSGGGSMTLDSTFPRVESVLVTKWEQYEKHYKRLLFGTDGYDRFGTVILDHITESQKLCQRWVMANALERATKKGKGVEDIIPEVPQQSHYLIMYEAIMQMLRDFRDLPVNFICTAHEKQDMNIRGGMKLKPSLSGQAKSDIPGLFDIVARLYTGKVGDQDNVRLFATQDTSEYVAKQRGTKLPPLLGNTTIEDILSYIPQGEEA